MDAANESPSSKLFNFLENEGASQKNREFNRHAAITAETLLNSHVFNDDVTVYLCGSFSEGSVTPCSEHDTDVVICSNTTPVVFDMNTTPVVFDINNKKRKSFFAEETDHPGFVKLRLLTDGKAATKTEIEDKYHKQFKIINDTTMYLNHEYILKFAEVLKEASVTGPAIASHGTDNDHSFDWVFALRSENLPPYACEWITRLETSGWLSKEQVDEMKQMGCMFIGVGFPDGEDKDIEWRLAFVLQERFLMACLSDIQLKVYILLKIYKNHVNDVEKEEDPISSYVCKTCLLHVIEETPEEIWSKENLIGCLERCLTYLSDRLKEEKCTNFFVDKKNIFDREKVRKSKALLIEKLDEMSKMSKMNPSFVYDQVTGAIVKARKSSPYSYTNYQFKIKQSLICIFVLVRDLLLYQIRPVGYKSLKSLRKLLVDVEKNTDDDLKAARAYVIPWIEIRMGMCLAANANGALDKITKAFEHIQGETNPDVLNVPLAKASIFLQLKKHQECLTELQQGEKCISQDTIVACYCELPHGYAGAPLSLQIHYDDNVAKTCGDKDINEIRKTKFAGCFCFLPSEEALVPNPLRNEMKLCKTENKGKIYDYSRSWVMVDAIVYLHTLFYLVGEATADRQRQNDAIVKLTKALQHNDYLCHKDGKRRHTEVGYNILGWIMIQEHKYLAAVRYFLKSWELRQNNNAAKYHIQELFDRLNKDGRLADDQKRILLQVICSALQLLPE